MTSTTEVGKFSDSSLIKTDKLGRLCTPPERREMLLDQFEGSGLSAAGFAAMIGIKYQTFAGWRQRRNKRRRSQSASPAIVPKSVQLVEAVAAPKPEALGGEGRLIVHLGGGVRMELSDANQVPLACALLKSLDCGGAC